jgi:hypothetical protein
MKRKIILFTLFCLLNTYTSLSAKKVADDYENSQDEEYDNEDEDEEEDEEEAALRKAQKRAEKKRQLMQERKIREQILKERKEAQEEAIKLDSFRESNSNATEYTINPDSVKLAIDLNPENFGFYSKDRIMDLSVELDLLLRGRAFLTYNYQFFDYLSVGLAGGIDYSSMSLASKIRQQMPKPTPSQFSALVGVNAKWRVTEWYLNSAFFVQPSLLAGRMWQTFVTQKTTHWRLRPGAFVGLETVFNSGLVLNAKAGAEFPFDFGTANPVKEIVEPLFSLSFGFGI